MWVTSTNLKKNLLFHHNHDQDDINIRLYPIKIWIWICTFLVWVLPYQHDHHQIMRNSCYDKLGVGIADTCQANQSTFKWGHNGKATLFLFFQWISFWEIRWQNMKYLSDFFWYFHVIFLICRRYLADTRGRCSWRLK